MTRIKLCGLTRAEDIKAVNLLRPEYAGFVFAKKSSRYIDREAAYSLRKGLSDGITPVGVFVNEEPETVAGLLSEGVIDMAQLHGNEDEAYINALRALTEKPVIKAFRIRSAADLTAAAKSSADHILLDAGAGDGKSFDWSLLKGFERPFFLAGGLDPGNVREALRGRDVFAVDVSSGIETGGRKDAEKMKAFVDAVRKHAAFSGTEPAK
ncbi:MAG TPA: N-(5'-phosphoribosyl)anthranilate isomerase [Lachnospiraceae bacterium]|nr:N-(5'-phosphoribosyl)anthranilate isomerase [Lachnospiraceae bacterium]